jgi:hypothetical protein
MKNLLFFATLSLIALLCLPAVFAGDEKPISKPGVLGNEIIYTTKRLASYDTIIIRDFDISNPELTNINAEEKATIDPIKGSIPKVISSHFVSKMIGMKKFKNVLSNEDTPDNAVILEGKINKLNGGHGAAKYFLGIFTPEGAKTNITVTGRLIDAKTGKELAIFSDVKSGRKGTDLGNIIEVLLDQAGDLGESLAKFVRKLY